MSGPSPADTFASSLTPAFPAVEERLEVAKESANAGERISLPLVSLEFPSTDEALARPAFFQDRITCPHPSGRGSRDRIVTSSPTTPKSSFRAARLDLPPCSSSNSDEQLQRRAAGVPSQARMADQALTALNVPGLQDPIAVLSGELLADAEVELTDAEQAAAEEHEAAIEAGQAAAAHIAEINAERDAEREAEREAEQPEGPVAAPPAPAAAPRPLTDAEKKAQEEVEHREEAAAEARAAMEEAAEEARKQANPNYTNQQAEEGREQAEGGRLPPSEQQQSSRQQGQQEEQGKQEEQRKQEEQGQQGQEQPGQQQQAGAKSGMSFSTGPRVSYRL